MSAPPNKPLQLPAAGLRRAKAALDTNRGNITRGRSLAAIRWAAARRDEVARPCLFLASDCVHAVRLGRLAGLCGAPSGSGTWQRRLGPSKGDFKVVLFLTDDLELLKEQWAQPTPPTLSWINAAQVGDELHAVLIFTGCSMDGSGFCRVVSPFALTDPQGRTRPSDTEYAVCLGKPPPPVGQLQLAEYAHTFGITRGPRGAYTVSATVKDQVSGTSLDLAVPLPLR